MERVYRVFVEKKPGFDIESRHLYEDLREQLHLTNLENLRVLNRYDVSGLDDQTWKKAITTVFSEPAADQVYEESLPTYEGWAFAVEYLPGQYDQRADSAAQCIQLLSGGERPIVRSSQVYILEGELTLSQKERIRQYIINPVDSHETTLEAYESLQVELDVPRDVEMLDGFIDKDDDAIKAMQKDMGLAMSVNDLLFVRDYFKKQDRNPSITEIRVIDTYWSDHCRHTTFSTRLEKIEIEDSPYLHQANVALKAYYKAREEVYGDRQSQKSVCLMDMAVMGMKLLKKRELLNDLDESDEINACSIQIDVDVDGKLEPWLLMFKNETHNHPTEIEPFGGAATCLGGAIRDPLSGRSYVYQAMRVTGSADPRRAVEDTIPGKLPQRKITTGAAAGYSSYGNQIGLATGQVVEVYDEGYMAKRMEIGAVIAAAPKDNVVREKPVAGDVVVLLGGQTGRDGCGGATGSSKAHDTSSIETCGAEVQKGNPPTERKIQRLFRNEKAARMIKKCNDFGAGGVCVAIGELADGLDIDLDRVPKKYEGLDGTELAISESQERMAVVLGRENVEAFNALAEDENLETSVVAKVTDKGRMVMTWRGKVILDIEREFLDTNGAPQYATAKISAPKVENSPFKVAEYTNLKDHWLDTIADLNVCSQRGLCERFDATIGAGTVLMPFGGRYQVTPTQAMAAKIPVLHKDTNTGSIMTFGFDPSIYRFSPFHGAVYAVLESLLRIACAGGDMKKVRLTFQEYFERLRQEPTRWGKPLAALLGALQAQETLGIPAIGGKDSMSGSFEDIDVPPTLVSFAVTAADMQHVISPEFKEADHPIALLELPIGEDLLPDYNKFETNCTAITKAIESGQVVAAHTIGRGGLAAVVTKMSLGNRIGAQLIIDEWELFYPKYGSVILELKDVNALEAFEGCNVRVIGQTQAEEEIKACGETIELDQALAVFEGALEGVFPIKEESDLGAIRAKLYTECNTKRPEVKIAKPRVFIPVFPGTNCEYDTAKAFEQAGAMTDVMVIKNLKPEHIAESLERMEQKIRNSQIIMLPGGFSLGDEPDGSGKFIANVFRSPQVAEAVNDLLKNRDGLMLGICNGFQALIKLGLVPYGEIRDMQDDSPTLTFNHIGRHQSRIVRTKVTSTLSPWMAGVEAGDIISVPISHGEGRFVCSEAEYGRLLAAGQIATQYVDDQGKETYDINHNPNGSIHAVEGITSPDGRVLGKMGHNERYTNLTFRNVPGEFDSKIFESGVNYFK